MKNGVALATARGEVAQIVGILLLGRRFRQNTEPCATTVVSFKAAKARLPMGFRESLTVRNDSKGSASRETRQRETVNERSPARLDSSPAEDELCRSRAQFLMVASIPCPRAPLMWIPGGDCIEISRSA